MKILLTGGAGFIGSNLARYFIERGHEVVVFDNFFSGKRENLLEIMDNITLIEADLRDAEAVSRAVAGVDAVSHQGAVGSVPRSVEYPLTSHDVNVNGTLHVLEAMREHGVKRIVFAASSSAYGHQKKSPKVETMAVSPASPYAASKVACESYIRSYAQVYGIEAVCMRYFNVFGPHQDPEGAYAAVIPKFVTALLHGERPVIYGDGGQSRDFCYIDNVCEANRLALNAPAEVCDGRAVNIACNRSVTLNRILEMLQELLGTQIDPIFTNERPGDVRHSQADITAAGEMLGYGPGVFFEEGLQRAIAWYGENYAT